MALAYPVIFHMKMDLCAAFNLYPREKLTVSSCRRTFSEYHEINYYNVIQLHPHCQQEGVCRGGAVIPNHPKSAPTASLFSEGQHLGTTPLWLRPTQV